MITRKVLVEILPRKRFRKHVCAPILCEHENGLKCALLSLILYPGNNECIGSFVKPHIQNMKSSTTLHRTKLKQTLEKVKVTKELVLDSRPNAGRKTSFIREQRKHPIEELALSLAP